MNENKSNNFMKSVATFIVDKRKAIYLVFIAAFIFCLLSINKVKVNNDITSYLPADTETRRGLTVMEDEFVTYATAQVMVNNITYERAKEIGDKIEELDGVGMFQFDDTDTHYKDNSALYTVQFEGAIKDEVSENAMKEIKSILEGYDTYILSEVGNDVVAMLAHEMSIILAIAAVVIFLVLTFTSKTYFEVVVFVIVFAVSAVFNMGTNYWFGEISFITNSISVVLQLALAIDYAIIFCHRYMEEKTRLPAREADIEALSKAIIEISSSSLTTISGLVALMLMQLRIGFDMGIVLSKGILCSLLTVFLLMPGLIMLFNRQIEKTRHRNFVPDITSWGRLMVKLRYILPSIFLVVIIFAFVFSSKCEYIFSINSINAQNKSEQTIAREHIYDKFGGSNLIAVLVPVGDYESEKAVLKEVENIELINSALGLANVEVENDRILTDKISPRQFSELAEVDIELARVLFQAYGLDKKEYGAIFQNTDDYQVPLLEVFLFLCDQKDSGVVSLSPEQDEKLEDLRTELDSALKQLKGDNYSRLVFTSNSEEESPETFALLDQIRNITRKYYGEDAILVGASTSAFDLSSSFSGDNLKISILTILFVTVILLFTFKSSGLPILLVLTIQGSIWINFSFPFIQHSNMYFLSYLIVSAIQMGATIDYAIVITNRYLALKQVMDKKEATIQTLNQSFPTVFTSGSIMTVAGFLISFISTEPTISSIGLTLGRGTFISIILVMTVLPQILYLFDTIIEKTAITVNRDRIKRYESTTLNVYGHIRGYVNGFVDADMKGVVHGNMSALMDSRGKEKIKQAKGSALKASKMDNIVDSADMYNYDSDKNKNETKSTSTTEDKYNSIFDFKYVYEDEGVDGHVEHKNKSNTDKDGESNE